MNNNTQDGEVLVMKNGIIDLKKMLIIKYFSSFTYIYSTWKTAWAISMTLDLKERVMLELPGVSLISTRPQMPLLSLMDW